MVNEMENQVENLLCRFLIENMDNPKIIKLFGCEVTLDTISQRILRSRDSKLIENLLKFIFNEASLSVTTY